MHSIKIGFVLLSNSKNPIPSTRVSILNMLPYLKKAKFAPHIVFEPDTGCETPDLGNLASKLITEQFEIVYFQKVYGKSVENTVEKLTAEGIKTIYGVCDLINVEMTKKTDATITVTDYLKSLYPPELQHKISVVHDGIEHPEFEKKDINPSRGSNKNKLNAVLVSSAFLGHLPVIKSIPKWLTISIIGRYYPNEQITNRLKASYWHLANLDNIEKRNEHFRFLLNSRIRCLPWHPTNVYQMMRQADIGIIPINTEPKYESTNTPAPYLVKSENRLTMKMSIGLPVIATPIPSYLPVIEQGENGFFARSETEWLETLELLRDPNTRYKIGITARKSVLQKYSQPQQAKKLIQTLKDLT